ncbi:MAG TPA: hypothetical protein VMF58_03200 [Rhizomicrobium sp.]|nr:hypothetical protein [Rhizomicrobium sp.]
MLVLLEVIGWTGQFILWIAEMVVWMVGSLFKAKKNLLTPLKRGAPNAI